MDYLLAHSISMLYPSHMFFDLPRCSALFALAWLLSGVAGAASPSQTPMERALAPRPIATSAEAPGLLLLPPPSDGPVVVKAGLELESVNRIDDEAETFEFAGTVTLTWHDSRQAFEADGSGFSDRVFQGSFQFDEIVPGWFPQLVLLNDMGEYDSQAIILRIRPDGTCILKERFLAVAKSPLKLRRYPFDEQRLEASFEIFGFEEQEVVLEVDPGATPTRRAPGRVSEWDLAGHSLVPGSQKWDESGAPLLSSAMTLNIEVRRDPFFVLRLVTVPLLIIVVLSWSVFWMDRSSVGDRINVSFIGILTAVAYQNVMSGIMPHISYVTFMHGFVQISLFAMCATVVVNLAVGAADRRGDYALGNLIDRRSRILFPLGYIGTVSIMFILAFFVL